MWLAFAIGASIVWGLDYVLAERVLHYNISSITLLSLELLIGGIIMSTIGCFTTYRHDIPIILASKPLCFLLFATMCTFCLANLLIFFSIQEKNATLSGLIELSYPLFIILFSWLLFRENYFSIKVLLGGVLIVSGVCIIGAK